jgi:hypothetical protein
MAGIYRLKKCPSCGTEHRKKGNYCSRSCGNKRTFTDEYRDKLSLGQAARALTDEGEAHRYMLQQHAKKQDLDWHIKPPVDQGGEVIDGDFWVEDN